MTKEEAKYYGEVLLAYAEGKTIEKTEIYLDIYPSSRWKGGKTWEVDENPRFDFMNFKYRVKTEFKGYRPFRNQEECWAEMKKHQPFGWIMAGNSNKFPIQGLHGERVRTSSMTSFDYQYMFDKFKFADGFKFGVKEEN